MEEINLLVSNATSENLYPALFQCFTIILCGYVAGRVNVVSQLESKGIGTFVGTFALPSLIFISLAKLDFTTVNWSFLLAILLAKAIIFFAVILVTLFVSKPIHLGRAGIFAIFCTQSNDFALGYPIITAIYGISCPEYPLYLYLMAPISLAILNPIAFVMMEINKQKEILSAQGKSHIHKLRVVKQIVKGVVYNPVLVMTVLGIIGNIAFKHQLPSAIEGLLQVLGKSFPAAALFLLGLRMVGQFHKLKGPALVLPFVLILLKLIILPIVMRQCVILLKPGDTETETLSLSTFAFLYGTIPTAPAVFVFSNLYNLETDLMASSMVICTFVSAPFMLMSAEMISIKQDYAEQLRNFAFKLALASIAASLWVLLTFIVTKKYKKVPHKLTFCLNITQIFLALTVSCWGLQIKLAPSWPLVLLQSSMIFSSHSCMLWTSMLAVALLLLQIRGPCFVLTIWPVLAFVAWGGPAVMLAALLATRAQYGSLGGQACNAIRLCLLIFCLTVSTGALILYVKFRRSVTALVTVPDESSPLIDNAEPEPSTSNTQSLSNNGCYGAITTTPSPSKSAGCCSNDPNCDINTYAGDIEDIGERVKDCMCPTSLRNQCAASEGPCTYATQLEEVGEQLGLQPLELGGHQLVAHTVLIIIYTLAMFIGLTYTVWALMMHTESGVFVVMEYLDLVTNYGQGLVMIVIFGLNPQEVFIPTVRYIKRKLYGTDVTLVLPPLHELPFETTQVCDQFVTHHLVKCRQAIAKDTRWRLRTYRGVFRGECLVRWLCECGLAGDTHAAAAYGRRLLDGRVITHINHTQHFTDSQLLYTFVTH